MSRPRICKEGAIQGPNPRCIIPWIDDPGTRLHPDGQVTQDSHAPSALALIAFIVFRQFRGWLPAREASAQMFLAGSTAV